MKTHRPCRQVRPSSEDVARITRLEEEIIGRVEEMVRILARINGRPPSLPVVKFTRHEGRATAGNSTEWVAWHEFTTAEGQTGCYDNIQEVSCAGPCPC